MRNEHHEREQRCRKVGDEDVADTYRLAIHRIDTARVAGVEPRTEHYKEEVQSDIHRNIHQFYSGKLERALAIAEISKGDGGESIERHGGGKQSYILGVLRDIEQHRQPSLAQKHDSHKERRSGGKGDERSGIHPHGVIPLFVGIGKAEEAGLHPVGEDNQRQSDKRIEIIHNPVFRSRKSIGIERNKTPIEEASDDAACTINGGVFS